MTNSGIDFAMSRRTVAVTTSRATASPNELISSTDDKRARAMNSRVTGSEDRDKNHSIKDGIVMQHNEPAIVITVTLRGVILGIAFAAVDACLLYHATVNCPEMVMIEAIMLAVGWSICMACFVRVRLLRFNEAQRPG